MTEEDILRMAKQVGLEYKNDELRSQSGYGVFLDDLTDFTALVVAATVEECAQLCEQMVGDDKYLAWAARVFAFAIRARGEK